MMKKNYNFEKMSIEELKHTLVDLEDKQAVVIEQLEKDKISYDKAQKLFEPINILFNQCYLEIEKRKNEQLKMMVEIATALDKGGVEL